MADKNPILPVITPHLSVLDLVSIARAGHEKESLRQAIIVLGVDLNGILLQAPDHMVTVQTGDILRLGLHDWHEIEVIDMNDIETERLRMKLLQEVEIDLLQEHLPEWDIVKYLSKTLPPEQAEEVAAREVFRRIITQPEPKGEWLWKVMQKENPDKIIGVAHLRTDAAHGNQNLWLGKEFRGKGLMVEASSAISSHAFEKLGFQNIEFKDAFKHAASMRELAALRKKFSSADEGTEHKTQGAPEKSWGLSKKKWERIKEKIKRPTAAPPVAPAAAPPAAPSPGIKK